MIRAFRRGLFVAFVSLSVACGGSKPPNAPVGGGGASGSSSSGTASASASAIIPDSDADATASVDLAGMRANKVFSQLMAEAERDPEFGGLLGKIDRIDIRAHAPKGAPPDIIANVWGKLPKDPRDVNMKGVVFADGKALPSGVTEFAEQNAKEAINVFVVGDGLWVLASGGAIDKVREKLSASAPSSSPPSSSGDLLRVHANAVVMGQAPGEVQAALGDVDHADVTISPDASSIRAALSYKDKDAAQQKVGEIRSLVAMLQMAFLASHKCKAFEKIAIDVKGEAKDVAVDVKGVADAVAVWDPAACAPSSDRSASSLATSPPEAPRKGDKKKNGTKPGPKKANAK